MTLDLAREDAIAKALLEAPSSSYRAAGKSRNIPPTTLRRRRDGGRDRHTAREKDFKITLQQEGEIANWILQREAACMPLKKAEVHGFAEVLAHQAGKGEPLGHNWVERFLRRHPEIKMKDSRLIEAERKNAVTEEGIRSYYSNLKKQIHDLNIGSDRIYNLNETGVQEGETSAGKVIGTSLTSLSEAQKSSASSWISILECINALGCRLTPLVIFSGENLQGQWFGDQIPDWRFTSSSSGWSNKDILKDWFRDVFEPETRVEGPSLWRMLILDRHKSHIDPEFMKMAQDARVWLSYLPQHTSHLTQPLNVALFGPLKTFYYKETRN